MNNPENKNENIESKKNAKIEKHKITTTPIRVKHQTRRKIINELARINKKDFGRKITADDLIALALGLIGDEHVHSLQQSTLSNNDRFEVAFRAHIKEHGAITKDEYLGKIMTGELQSSSASA